MVNIRCLRLAGLYGLLMSNIVLIQAQYLPGSGKYEEELNKQEADQKEELKSLSTLESHYYPSRSQIDINIYRFEEPSDYVIGLLVDPCKGKHVNCCDNGTTGIYGAAEYRADPLTRNAVEGTGVIAASTILVDEYGEDVALINSRWADDEYVLDDECVGDQDPFDYCMGMRQRHQVSSLSPVCWDNNATVVASYCQNMSANADESACMDVGFTQTAYIVICGGSWKDSEHCGTFLEVHRPGGSPYDDENTILGQVRLTTQETTGYVHISVPLTYMLDDNKVLCNYDEANDGQPGNYELWWVKRTKFDFIIEKKKRFRVTEPPCSYDSINSRFFPFAWRNETLSDSDNY